MAEYPNSIDNPELDAEAEKWLPGFNSLIFESNLTVDRIKLLITQVGIDGIKAIHQWLVYLSNCGYPIQNIMGGLFDLNYVRTFQHNDLFFEAPFGKTLYLKVRNEDDFVRTMGESSIFELDKYYFRAVESVIHIVPDKILEAVSIDVINNLSFVDGITKANLENFKNKFNIESNAEVLDLLNWLYYLQIYDSKSLKFVLDGWFNMDITHGSVKILLDSRGNMIPADKSYYEQMLESGQIKIFSDRVQAFLETYYNSNAKQLAMVPVNRQSELAMVRSSLREDVFAWFKQIFGFSKLTKDQKQLLIAENINPTDVDMVLKRFGKVFSFDQAKSITEQGYADEDLLRKVMIVFKNYSKENGHELLKRINEDSDSNRFRDGIDKSEAILTLLTNVNDVQKVRRLLGEFTKMGRLEEVLPNLLFVGDLSKFNLSELLDLTTEVLETQHDVRADFHANSNYYGLYKAIELVAIGRSKIANADGNHNDYVTSALGKDEFMRMINKGKFG